MNSTVQHDCVLLPLGRLSITHLEAIAAQNLRFVVIIIHFVSLPICVIGNALVILAIITTPSLQIPANIFIGSLAVADFLVGIAVQPFAAFLYLKDGAIFNCDFIDAFILSGTVVFCCSVTGMALVSCDRFVALFYPLRYPALINNRRAFAVCICVWVFLILNGFMSLYFVKASLVVSAVDWMISCSLIGITYYKIFLLVRHHRRQIHSQQASVSTQNAIQRKQAITMGYVIGISIFCYIPFSIVALVFFFGKSSNAEILASIVLTKTFQFMSSSINPVVYCWKRQDFRGACLNMLRKCYRWLRTVTVYFEKKS